MSESPAHATPTNDGGKTINLLDMSESNESPSKDDGMTLSEMDREIEKQKEEYDDLALDLFEDNTDAN